eukprot:TRINITY_DN1958_c0_g1_i1.p1 TRINITY_DN1958_c0_g1~~TRINITY_DN1958_c0_g1_i1.p1  ORF type:complete len:816 (-),score=160.85 TRINITY_DN1958_c0_g1_i1:26-2473(-)
MDVVDADAVGSDSECQKKRRRIGGQHASPWAPAPRSSSSPLERLSLPPLESGDEVTLTTNWVMAQLQGMKLNETLISPVASCVVACADISDDLYQYKATDFQFLLQDIIKDQTQLKTVALRLQNAFAKSPQAVPTRDAARFLTRLLSKYGKRERLALQEQLDTSMQALNLEEPLKKAKTHLAKGHSMLNSGGNSRGAALVTVLACPGKGKSRFLHELSDTLNQEENSICIPITFNGKQMLGATKIYVNKLTRDPDEQAIVHLGLRLLHSTFSVPDVRIFAREFCKELKISECEIDNYFLEEVVRLCHEKQDGAAEKVTIIVDESGKLSAEGLTTDSGAGDEFSALRDLASSEVCKRLGFSCMVLQAGLGDFAVRTMSGRDVVVVCLLDFIHEEAIDKLIMPVLQTTLSDFADLDLWEKLVVDPLMAEYRLLPRAVECFKNAIAALDINFEDQITSKAALGCAIRKVGLRLRDEVDEELQTKYGEEIATLLTPEVLAPAILPSRRLQVNLLSQLNGRNVSELLSRGVYVNSLRDLDRKTEFVPNILPAFLRKAAETNEELKHFKPWWQELDNVLAAQANGTQGAGRLLERGLQIWTCTILLALSKWQHFEGFSLADLFPTTVPMGGSKEAVQYQLQVPKEVNLLGISPASSLNLSISPHERLRSAIELAKNSQTASVFELIAEHPGADAIALLPLRAKKRVLLLGLESHGISSGAKIKRHRSAAEYKRKKFWEALHTELKQDSDVEFALLYITHDDVDNAADDGEGKEVEEEEKEIDGPTEDLHKLTLLIMEREKRWRRRRRRLMDPLRIYINLPC